MLGSPQELGDGTFRTYVQQEDDRRPIALGIVFPPEALDSLPQAPHDGNRCLDLDQSGSIELEDECVGGHERVLFLPEEWQEGERFSGLSPMEGPNPTPFRWVLLNRNPAGHGPEGVWDVPHFDFHFFIQPLNRRNQIRLGRCEGLIHCDDVVQGTVPPPEPYLPEDYLSSGVVEFGMGMHLVDSQAPELGGEEFTRTFVYGAWSGRISFYEPMIALEWLRRLQTGEASGGCAPIKPPQEWRLHAFYPRVYCVRFHEDEDVFTVSLESFAVPPRW